MGKWGEMIQTLYAHINKKKKEGGQKIACSPSYADFRHKTNAVILFDMGHMLRGEYIPEE
jgi:hypothetical protein